ncbi:MAG TPA: hypothetical protein VNZ22_16160, partial [Bacillota bacterium]|nr:hypothetical protein [Bacillota bacterium]
MPAAGASKKLSSSTLPPAKPPSGRRWVFRLGALVLGPLLILGCLEGALRLCGYGFPTSFFKPVTIGGQEYLVDNDQFSLRFFPPALARIPAPVLMQAHKPADTIRIFVFGESAALGDPRPHFGASRYLEVLLRERFPNTRFEIVNTGITAINSHVILPIARECARHQGDIWIVYMGNNEMVGPFGAATVFGGQAPPLGMVRLSLAVQQTRLGQLLMASTRKLGKRSAATANWHGMEMFLQNQVLPQDPRKEVVYRSFRRNLEDILRAGQKAEAKILLNTVAVNLMDCPPFATLTSTNLAEADRAPFEQACG